MDAVLHCHYLRMGVSETEVTAEDREHAKRIVYSVVYGAGEA